MEKFKLVTFSEEFMNKYVEGSSNRFARYYTYLQRGFGLFNETKNYILILFTTYWTVKTADYWLGFGISDLWLAGGLLGLAILGLGILLLVGRWDLYVLAKAREALNAKDGSILQFKGHNISVWNVNLMEAVAGKLGVDIEKLKEELETNDR